MPLDYSQIPTDQLQAMVQASSAPAQSQPAPQAAPTQGAVDYSKIPTDQLQAMVQTSQNPAQPAAQVIPTTATGVTQQADTQANLQASHGGLLGEAEAGVKGFAENAISTAQGFGKLANTILSNTVGKVVPDSANKFAGNVSGAVNATMKQTQNAVANNPELMKAEIANPKSYGTGAALGAVGANVAIGGGVGNAAAKGVAKALLPGLLEKSPTIANALSQSAVGATAGAASDPSNPIKGAVIGGTLGGVFGGIGGNAGENVRVAGKVISDTTESLLKSGNDPTTLSSVRILQKNLADEGLEYRQYDLKQAAKAAVDEQLAQLRPTSYVPGTSPIKTIADKIQSNYPKVAATNKANYAPIDSNTQTFAASNYNKTLNDVKDALPKIGLPVRPQTTVSIDPVSGVKSEVTNNVTTLPPQATLGQMLEHRQLLDGTIAQAQKQELAGKIPHSAVAPYYQLRQSLNQDIHDSANSVGLGDQLNKAETYNNQYVQPFKKFTKAGVQITNPKAETRIWQSISSELQARRPNFETIRQNAAMLGPDGKELVGWGLQENAFNKATTLSGEYNPNMHQSALTRMNATGLLDEVSTPVQKSVARATSDILEESTKVKTGAPQQSGVIMKAVNSMRYSRPGIELLRVIGNPSTSAQVKRTLIQNIITSTVGARLGQMNNTAPPSQTEEQP